MTQRKQQIRGKKRELYTIALLYVLLYVASLVAVPKVCAKGFLEKVDWLWGRSKSVDSVMEVFWEAVLGIQGRKGGVFAEAGEFWVAGDGRSGQGLGLLGI